MKSYEEIAEGILTKRDEYYREKKAKQKLLIRTLTASSLFAAAVFTVVCIYESGLLKDDFVTVPDTSSENIISTSETIDSETDEYISVPKDPEFDSADSDGIHTSPLSDPFNDPSVIWGTVGSKGETASEITVPSGSIYFSDSLKELISANDSSAVFAVRVDFSPCIEKGEEESFVYNGETIISLKEKLDTSDKESVSEYKRRVKEIRREFYTAKVSSFSDTFIKSGITIYTPDSDTYILSDCFLVFATSEQLNEITCNTGEAFILFPASRLK